MDHQAVDCGGDAFFADRFGGQSLINFDAFDQFHGDFGAVFDSMRDQFSVPDVAGDFHDITVFQFGDRAVVRYAQERRMSWKSLEAVSSQFCLVSVSSV